MAKTESERMSDHGRDDDLAIDLDRVIADPSYRRVVIERLNAQPVGRGGERRDAALPELRPGTVHPRP